MYVITIKCIFVLKYPMKKTLYIFFIIFSAYTISKAQIKEIDYINSDIKVVAKELGWDVGKHNTAKDSKFLTNKEKDVIFCLNMVRSQPEKFTNDFVRQLDKCFDGNTMTVPGGSAFTTQEGVKAVKELIKVLPKTKGMNVLLPSKGLSNAAKELAIFQEKTGKTGHIGENGASLSKRISKFGKYTSNIAENVSYGEESAIMVVISLLIDDGVSSRGHRINILNANLKLAGAKWAKHPKFKQMCAITFAANFTEQ